MSLKLKMCGTMLSLATVTAFSSNARAGCNCSVPPSPSGTIVSAMPGPVSTGAYYGHGGGAYHGQVGGAYNGYGGGTYYGPYHGNSPGSMSATAYGATMPPFDASDSPGPHWAPGGYEARIGSPVYWHDPAGGQYVVTGDPYYDHFGPGFQRDQLHGHYRFPYYNYRAPWYFPGRAVYNRNTNFPW